MLNITVDDVSGLQSWEKEALLKTLLADVKMNFKTADLVMGLYVDAKIYNGNPEKCIVDQRITKFVNYDN